MAIALWKSRWKLGAAVLPALGMFVVAAQAQNPQGNQVVPPGQTLPSYIAEKPITPDMAPTPNADHDVAEWLQIENNGEVAMAKLAESKTQNLSVKHFAEHMIHDHLQALRQLPLFEASNMAPPAVNNSTANTNVAPPEGPSGGGRATIAGTPTTPAIPGTPGTPIRAADVGSVPTPGSVPNSSTVPTPGGLSVPGTNPVPRSSAAIAPQPPQPPQLPQGAPAIAGFTAAGQSRSGLDFLEVKRQIGSQCLTDSTKQWDSMKGAEADVAYIGQQIVAHENYIDTSKVLRRYASPRLRDVIDQGMQMAQSHLDEAKEIMRELTESNYSARQDNANPK